MKKLNKVLFPPLFMIIFSILICTFGLIYIFVNGYDDSIIAYVFYAYSAYTLVILVIRIIKNWNDIVDLFTNNRITNTKFVQHYQSDLEFRKNVSVYTGFMINVIYVIFKGVMGLVYESVWELAQAFYYLVLSIVRANLIRVFNKTSKMDDDKEIKQSQIINAKRSGYLMLLLNMAMNGIVIQMIWDDHSTVYPGFTIYVSALYTFYLIIHLIVHMVKYRKVENALIQATTQVSFAQALMSLFSLQTGMIATFGSDPTFGRIMNTLTGAAVMILVFILALFMIKNNKMKLKKLHSNIEEKEYGE